MDGSNNQQHALQKEEPSKEGLIPDPVRRRFLKWHQIRTWAQLIREAESLWHVDVKELKRLGELELSQLLQEVPISQRSRVNRWLNGYYVATRFQQGREM